MPTDPDPPTEEPGDQPWLGWEVSKPFFYLGIEGRGQTWDAGIFKRPYASVLPLYYTRNADDPDSPTIPYYPAFGYLNVAPSDSYAFSPEVAHTFVIPLDRAIRLAYEQAWLMQCNVIGNWGDFLFAAIRDKIIHFVVERLARITMFPSLANAAARYVAELFLNGKEMLELNVQISGHWSSYISQLKLNHLPHPKDFLTYREAIAVEYYYRTGEFPE